jgi:hypothetical protein
MLRLMLRCIPLVIVLPKDLATVAAAAAPLLAATAAVATTAFFTTLRAVLRRTLAPVFFVRLTGIYIYNKQKK